LAVQPCREGVKVVRPEDLNLLVDQPFDILGGDDALKQGRSSSRWISAIGGKST
jgi:hypothetical protein